MHDINFAYFGIQGAIIACMIWAGFYLNKSSPMTDRTPISEVITINANAIGGHIWWVGAIIVAFI